MRDTYYERISHAESTVAVTHAVGGPSLREALQLDMIELTIAPC